MFFRPKGRLNLKVDIHSHLIPGVDDGVKSIDQSIEIIKKFHALGYSKLVTTPHISEQYYPNSIAILQKGFKEVKKELVERSIDIVLELGAEYMVDGLFLNQLKQNEEVLSWQGYVLVETSFHTFPMIFDEVIFLLKSRGLQPVLAHPERYEYLAGNLNRVREIRERGVCMQVTASSFVGGYGAEPQKMAKSMLKESLIDFMGSDMHRIEQIEFFEKGLGSKGVRDMDTSYLLNNSLIN